MVGERGKTEELGLSCSRMEFEELFVILFRMVVLTIWQALR